MKNNQKYINKKTVISRTLGATRYIMVFAIFAIFLGSTLLLIIASLNMLQGIWHEIIGANIESQHEIKIILIESIDSILISTVLYVIAAGLYQLFINQS